jgi:hypothetical protein
MVEFDFGGTNAALVVLASGNHRINRWDSIRDSLCTDPMTLPAVPTRR